MGANASIQAYNELETTVQSSVAESISSAQSTSKVNVSTDMAIELEGEDGISLSNCTFTQSDTQVVALLRSAVTSTDQSISQDMSNTILSKIEQEAKQKISGIVLGSAQFSTQMQSLKSFLTTMVSSVVTRTVVDNIDVQAGSTKKFILKTKGRIDCDKSGVSQQSASSVLVDSMSSEITKNISGNSSYQWIQRESKAKSDQTIDGLSLGMIAVVLGALLAIGVVAKFKVKK